MVGTSDERILVLHPENLSINLGSVSQVLLLIFELREKIFKLTKNYKKQLDASNQRYY